MSDNGYYQEVDECVYYDNCDIQNNKNIKQKSATKKRYYDKPIIDTSSVLEIVDLEHDAFLADILLSRMPSFTKSDRIKYITSRNNMYDIRKKIYNLIKKYKLDKNIPNSYIYKQCKHCGGGFVAKKADIKRGWAKFCSKECKARSN